MTDNECQATTEPPIKTINQKNHIVNIQRSESSHDRS